MASIEIDVRDIGMFGICPLCADDEPAKHGAMRDDGTSPLTYAHEIQCGALMPLKVLGGTIHSFEYGVCNEHFAEQWLAFYHYPIEERYANKHRPARVFSSDHGQKDADGNLL